MTRYRTIVADPPWPIGNFPEWSDGTGSIARPYDVMNLADISAMPVSELAEDEAHLYLWTINEYVADAYTVARAWGFSPSTLLVWCKPPMGVGLGGLFPSNVEFVLYATRHPRHADIERVLALTRWINGHVKRAGIRHSDILKDFGFNRGSGQVGHWTALSAGAQPSIPTVTQWQRLKVLLSLPPDFDEEIVELNAIKNPVIPKEIRQAAGGRWFQWPRGEHSAKPEAFLDLVEQVSPAPRLEMFARRARFGWDYWGDQSLSTVEMPA